MRASTGRTLTNQFLAEFDDSSGLNEGVIIVSATNAPWHIDSAFLRPGRFARILFVPPPDDRARKALIEMLCRNKPVEKLNIKRRWLPYRIYLGTAGSRWFKKYYFYSLPLSVLLMFSASLLFANFDSFVQWEWGCSVVALSLYFVVPVSLLILFPLEGVFDLSLWLNKTHRPVMTNESVTSALTVGAPFVIALLLLSGAFILDSAGLRDDEAVLYKMAASVSSLPHCSSFSKKAAMQGGSESR